MDHFLPSQNPHQFVHELYLEHHDWLQQWLHYRISYPFNAADIVQDTFCKLLQNKNLFLVQQPRAYLVNIAKHLLIDQQRRYHLEKNYLAQFTQQLDEHALNIDSNQVEEAVHILDFLTVALQSTHALARKAFLLYYFEGYSQSEVAQAISKSLRSTQLYLAECLNLCFVARQQLLESGPE
ncbi:RNA polymerase sigma-70 factor (ECF subfamily) [Acinetobacter calcoaceticus]|uniref:RNA polymerase sigma-70 factor (ECF subfamily) n=1 Tax=Acinetobacter calcoaceticus TaxID=471 RepID=A0A4R1Y3Q7_ACICA|nr:RNA polymerase sigma-70 factor (ECF subfamily) [Acinetobacter calcoaceticus]